jgi:hypothetical protein
VSYKINWPEKSYGSVILTRNPCVKEVNQKPAGKEELGLRNYVSKI